jgi:hypothetical protein
MSAYDPKRTLSSKPVERDPRHNPQPKLCDMLSHALRGARFGEAREAVGTHHISRWRD